jgi:L-fuconolactonase
MHIDAHHHFWRYDPVEYNWIDEPLAAIRRDFLPQDLASTIQGAGIDGVVSVQARQSLSETHWLLQYAAEHDFIRGVVGWAPLIEGNVATCLDRLAENRLLRGVRHVVQGEPDDRFILRDDFNAGVSLLKQLGLVYDILIFERHLPQTIEFVDRHPEQMFVLDHVAKPRIKENQLEPWRSNLTELARRENVFCKFSGLVTEADYHAWTPAQLRPYWDAALESFGPARLMFASDWPVCLAACEYHRWREVVGEFAAELSASEQEQVFGYTAKRAYNL